MSAPPATLPVPCYQGSANTWECDEAGHLNVRFHIERACAGLGYLSHALRMSRVFESDANATLLPLDLHIRFLREARPGEGLIMHGGVLDFADTEARLCLDMRHADGGPSSAFTFRLAHVEPRTLKAFPWSAQTRAAAKELTSALPKHAAPRSIDVKQKPSEAGMHRAQALGLKRIGGLQTLPPHCDAFGRLRPEMIFGAISDSIANLLGEWRAALAAEQNNPVEPVGALVETRIVYRRWPRAGDLIDVRSGIVESAEKTLRIVHWLLDPETGAAWASVEAVALTFDRITRKTIAPSEAARKAMAALQIKGLSI